MRNSNKTREKITGVLIGLVLSALCVTPAFAAGMDSTSLPVSVKFSIILKILGILLAGVSVYKWIMFTIDPNPSEWGFILNSSFLSIVCFGVVWLVK